MSANIKMPKWSKEQQDLIKQKVRSVLIRRPRASKYELARILDIDKDVALRIKNEILKERADFIDKQKINQEVGRLEQEYEELALECWQIISNDEKTVIETKGGDIIEKPKISYAEKLAAVRALIENKKVLFGIKFDAGIFKKKIGEMSLSATDILNIIKKNVDKGTDKDNKRSDT